MPFEGSSAGSGPRLAGEPACSGGLCQGWCQDHPVVVPHLHSLYGHFPGARLQTSFSDSPEGGKDKRAVPRGPFETSPC